MRIIPNPERKEWRQLLTGEINPKLKNFFFQMKVSQSRRLVETGKKDLDEAVRDLYELVVKFSRAKYMDEDIISIFGSLEEFKTEDEVVDAGKEKPVAEAGVQFPVKQAKEDTEKSELERMKKVLLESEKRIRRKQLELEEKLAKERMKCMQMQQKDRMVEETGKTDLKETDPVDKKGNITETGQIQVKKPANTVSGGRLRKPEQSKKVLFSKTKTSKELNREVLQKKINEEKQRLERIRQQKSSQNKTKKSFFQRLFGM